MQDAAWFMQAKSKLFNMKTGLFFEGVPQTSNIWEIGMYILLVLFVSGVTALQRFTALT